VATTDQAVHLNIILPDGRETAIAFKLPEVLPEVVFVAGRVRGTCTDVLGVFSVQGLAEQACTTPDDFVGPMRLDVRDTDDVHPWADQYFPLREGRRE